MLIGALRIIGANPVIALRCRPRFQLCAALRTDLVQQCHFRNILIIHGILLMLDARDIAADLVLPDKIKNIFDLAPAQQLCLLLRDLLHHLLQRLQRGHDARPWRIGRLNLQPCARITVHYDNRMVINIKRQRCKKFLKILQMKHILQHRTEIVDLAVA